MRIYIAAVEEKAGKTALILGLGALLGERGTVGYLKPVGWANTYRSGKPFDRDGEVVARALGLRRDPGELVPVLGSDYPRYWRPPRDAWEVIRAAAGGWEVDFLLVEGRQWLGRGLLSGLSDVALAAGLEAPILLVSNYEGEASVDRILRAQRTIGPEARLLGVVLNGVAADPELPEVRGYVVPFLEERGIPVLGVLPFERRLRAVPLAEVVEALGGEVLVEGDPRAEVERFLVGAMGGEAALGYLRRIPGKLAVVTGGDRVDIQVAALGCPRVKGLILTGGLRPEPSVLARAAETGTIVVLVPQDTMTAAETAEGLIGRATVSEEALGVMRGLVAEGLDLERLLEYAGR